MTYTSQNYFEKEEQRRFTLFDSNGYYKATVIKTL